MPKLPGMTLNQYLHVLHRRRIFRKIRQQNQQTKTRRRHA